VKPRSLNEKLVTSYLNDHLAGATAGLELVRRAARENAGNRYAGTLERVAAEIDEDREALKEVMAALDVSHDRLKLAAGWLGEKLGRAKLNGSVFGYSPLSRLVELEALTIGVEAKRALWQALAAVEGHDARLAGFDFKSLADRALRHRRTLERLREHAADDALATGP
jgi:hypothetical protein